MIDVIKKLRNKENLTEEEIESVMAVLMSGKSAHEDIKDFLLALNVKGPTVEEITGAAKILRKFLVPVKTRHKVVLDTCGTGGDRKGTFNISTVVAFVVAGAGIVVAKHGNRSVSSQCGSADVLEALGVNLDAEEGHLGKCLDEIGIAFLFAQRLHPAMKNVAIARKELGVRTIFNILGPLVNPAKASHQIMGVYSQELVQPLTQVLSNLGLKRAMVAHGADGLDEISTTSSTFIGEYNGKEILSYEINPEELGIPVATEDEIKGGDLKDNVEIVQYVLSGKKGPKRDIVVLNAAYALYVAEKVKNISDGIKLAQNVIDAGKAQAKLEALVKFTKKVKK